MILFPLETLQEINGDYFNVPEIIEKEYTSHLGNDIEKLPDKINELWRQHSN